MKTRQLSTQDDLRRELEADRDVVTRYAARFILVDGLQAWRETLSVLDAISESTVALSSLAGRDELPMARKVVDAIASLTTSATLLPLGEVLRLAPSLTQTYIAALTRIEALGKRRLYVPMLAVSGSVLPALEAMFQYVEYSPPVWCVSSPDSTQVTVTAKAYGCLPGRRIENLQAYLRDWEAGGASSTLLVTGNPELYRSSHSAVELRVLPTPFDVVRSCCPHIGEDERVLGEESEWDWLASQMQHGEGIDGCARRKLGLVAFQPDHLWALWRHLEPQSRWLAWLWARSELSGDGPAALAIRESDSPEGFEEAVANVVFDLPDPGIEWLEERRQLLSLILASQMPEGFWCKFKRVRDPFRRLVALAGLTDREQEAAVEAVGELVTSGASPGKWLPVLEIVYPDLHAYLTMANLDEWLNMYFALYRRSRVSDTARPELMRQADEWAQQRMMWRYTTRAQVLEQLRIVPDDALWVDGMGLEWADLLWYMLSSKGLHVDVTLARANMPTVTAANHDWTSAAVMRDLDGYAHSHEYAYPRSIVRQIKVIRKIAEYVEAQLRDRPVVIVTADHGLTRYASAGERVSVPEGYHAHRWGRHAVTNSQGDYPDAGDGPWIDDGSSLCLARHGLFTGGGANSGEVHGGATPEESLVPVLRVSRLGRLAPMVTSSDAQVRLDVRGRGLLHVVLSEPCQQLSLNVSGNSYAGRRNPTTGWDFDVVGLTAGRHSGQLVYEGGLIGTIAFECIRGMTQNDLGI